MGDQYPVIKVAAVQAASVFLDREKSTEKACDLIREAGRNGAELIAFPEGFIPAHPIWYHHHPATSAVVNELAVELFKNSVVIPGSEVDALCAAARDAQAYVVMGICEKLANTLGTMFNSQVCISFSRWMRCRRITASRAPGGDSSSIHSRSECLEATRSLAQCSCELADK